MSKTLIILLLIPFSAFAQFTITGKIVNRNDDQPVTNVSAFLSNTTIGTSTNANGVFNLTNVRPGKYDLICSKIGFGVYSISVVVGNKDITLPHIQLSPQAIILQEVKIKDNYDPVREQNLDMFRKEFIGISDLARQCKIINPETLDLKYDDKIKTLTAKSADFLVIENKALGYRIKYLLSKFELNEYDPNVKRFYYEGSVFFEEMKGDSAQKIKWQEKRKEVYANTSVHFLRAALHNTLGNEGFTAFRFLLNPERPADSIINSKIRIFTILSNKKPYRDSLNLWTKKSKLSRFLPKQIPKSVTGRDIIKKTTKPGEYALVAENSALYVIYDKSRQIKPTILNRLYDQNDASTLVFFNAPLALFDARGVIANTGSLSFEGKWAKLRLAELLPMDYMPDQNAAAIDSALLKLINEKIQAYSQRHRIEKAYLHFDKPCYAAGDTIYFKAYVTNDRHQSSEISRILTTEIIRPSGDILTTLKLQLADGMSAGDFAIPDSLNGGTYRIRAYTNVMRNAGEDYQFDQNLKIVNKSSKEASAGRAIDNKSNKDRAPAGQTLSSKKIDVQFFPEGGNLVNGVLSKIAFKAIAPNGLGVGIRGVITDESGDQVASISSQHLDMGVVTIKPTANKKYTCSITYNGGTAAFDLPRAVDVGYALAIESSDADFLKVNINSGQQNHENRVTLVGQSRGTVCYYTSGKLVNHGFSVTIAKGALPEGIVQFTLFSDNAEPMNERLVFVRHRNEFALKLSTEKPVYHLRDKVIANLIVTDNNTPAIGSFSVAVTNVDEVPVNENNESTILSNFLLTSDIKGNIEMPGYYFNDKNKKAASDLDVLLLTQGYHRFEWRQILSDKSTPGTYQSEKQSTVSGTINNAGGKPIPHAKVSMSSISKAFFNLDTIADEHGKFMFEHFPIIDSIRYIIQASDKEVRKKSFIDLDQRRYQKISEVVISGDTAAKENSQLLAFSNLSEAFHQEQIKQGIGGHGIALKGVTIKDKAEKKFLKNSENLNGPGHANDVITADQLSPAAPTFKDAIVGHLHGIQYVDGNFYYGMFPTLVILDGVEIPGNLSITAGYFKTDSRPSQAGVMNSIPVSQIASVEIITDASLAAIYGVRGAGGVIIVTTKRWNDVVPNGSFKTHFAYFSPIGFYKARTFYSPKYNSVNANTQFSDLRTTIYWDPFVNSDETGKAQFEFFNADTKGTYRMVIEGMDNQGHLGRQVYDYKVE